ALLTASSLEFWMTASTFVMMLFSNSDSSLPGLAISRKPTPVLSSLVLLRQVQVQDRLHFSTPERPVFTGRRSRNRLNTNQHRLTLSATVVLRKSKQLIASIKIHERLPAAFPGRPKFSRR